VPTEPQDAYGAATRGWPLRTQIKSAQATDGRLRQDPESGAKQHIRSEDNLVDEHKGTSYGLGQVSYGGIGDGPFVHAPLGSALSGDDLQVCTWHYQCCIT
jgi:hypothetical protein